MVSPAKVNLYLAVGARRDDGFHDVATVLHALSMHDLVYLRMQDDEQATDESVGPRIEVTMLSRGETKVPTIEPADNLAYQAVELLARKTGKGAGQLVEIHIEKNISAEAGLGGGSSNAAAALVGAAYLWGIDVHDDVVSEAACELGSDVAFFLHGGCAYLEGKGDSLVRKLEPMHKPVVIVKPEGGVSTCDAYRTFDEAPAYVDRLTADALAHASSADEVPLFNNLAPASEQLLPDLVRIREMLEQHDDVEHVMLCGSGSATFAICSTQEAANRVVADARREGLWARSTAFGSIRAAVVPD